MAFPSDAERAKQRREEERVRAREEQKREAEVERREEEQRERDREEERRQEALRQAQAFEAADEAERQRREAFRSRVRQQLRSERRSAVREQVRRDARLEALRAANSQERRDDQEEAARDAQRREELQQQAAIDRHEDEQREQRQGEQNAERERREKQQAAEERRENDERPDSRRADQGDADRRAAAARARQDERREAASEARRQSVGDARRDAERDANRAEDRREAALQMKRAEQQQAEASEARRQSVRDGRLAERRDAERASERAAERASERAAERAGGRPAAREEPKPRAKPAPPGRDPLQARIPSGVLSGALPWLIVDKNRIVNLDGQPVLLRGISMLGMDSAPPDPERGFAAGAGITESTIDAILEWGANVIRVSINRQRVLNGSGTWSAAHYLQDLDWIVRRAAEGGAYTILSLRRLDESTVFGTLPAAAGGPTPNVIAPQPDYDTVGMWQLLGARYSDEPAVLFDLYTSPHAALADDLTGFDTDWDLWALWVRLIVAELRRLHPRALCIVSGLNWATDLSGFPIIGTESGPVPNLVYAAQLSPRLESPLIAMRALSRSHPLFVTEWGAPTEVSWCERTALVLRDAGVGWTAAHWNGEPFLARAVARQTSPTQFGLVVRRALALPGDRIGRIA